MEKALVSVVIPTYKRPENLLRAIESVKAQTYPYIEIIVVDDNGMGTEWQQFTQRMLHELIEDNTILYIVHEVNKNGSAARNTGFAVSKGAFVNFLDDDDVFEPTKIEKQMECLARHDKTFGACVCNTHIVGFNRSFTIHVTKEGNLAQEVLMGEVRFNTSNVLFRKETFQAINGFDESFRRHQDWELCIRFFRYYKVCTCKESLLVKYNTPNVMTLNPLKGIEYKEKFLRTYETDLKQMPRWKEIYKCQYEMLALGLLKGGYKNIGWSYARKAFGYGLPSMFVTAKYLYWTFKGKKTQND
ncbi:glycosyltransferase family 2 protein [Phocaeicola sartorii]|jgi:glycosyltransferase|uniref:Glycosyltransferase 2-like domain-containing protein n=1 Tax=Phocaeicola sartorii TaxID=671267 RepID=R9I8S1_9BACT|nr:glycosyltransferase family A protein [Phocaeicola sartorii]EOS13052.1 hypothetical protein C802_01797 [Phocaeicola sartorii]MCR1846889.1 glycosyltransferase family 2 protein [Phocaeicola sartorii]NUL00118.1 glycosyltransferase family 2 protein [Phocaeicola sartorii]